MPNRTQLFSVENGVVSKIISEDSGSSLGNAIFIKLQNGNELVYAHLNKVLVSVGDRIQINDLIGLSGNSGNTVGVGGGYHLHLGLRNASGQWLNPDQYIPLIQNMGNNMMQFSDNMQKLDAANMLSKALESLSELAVNFIQ